MKNLLAFCTLVALTSGQQHYFQQSAPPPYVYQQQQFRLQQQQAQPELAHRDVIENSYRESMLPSEYQNKFYQNPRVADALAKESWFTSQEMPVFDRAAAKIPREMVFKIFKNAGWIKSR